MSTVNPFSYKIGGQLGASVRDRLAEWRDGGKMRRLWQRDATLWTGADEASWLGWLDITREQLQAVALHRDVAQDVHQSGFTHALLLGMGGSSLCPEVLQMTFPTMPGYPRMHVLDSTDPAQVKTFENKVDLARALFIVASKSGTTLEPTIFMRYFYERVKQSVGKDKAGSRFIAITDPGSQLEKEAAGFRRICHGVKQIGGRFSALSNFGMIPAAIMGIDTERFLRSAQLMVEACSADIPADENPGALLGAILGEAALSGRDKLTIIASPGLSDLGAWLEQLVAESTGKEGKAIIPLDREPAGSPGSYGDDRLFAYIRFAPAPDPAQEVAIAALEQGGQPVLRITVGDPYDLGQEFFRWEIATAVAGSVMGINPFNQPDVQFSKTETKKLTDAYEATGALPAESPILSEHDIHLFAAADYAATLGQGQTSLVEFLRAHLNRIGAADYFALLAYVEMNAAHDDILQSIRRSVFERRRVATCLGFGPRFLHSTGQAYKAGPNSGVFLQVTCDDSLDLPVPGQRYTFGVVKAAQARGDFQVLADRNRRALRVHIGAGLERGLGTLKNAIETALA